MKTLKLAPGLALPLDAVSRTFGILAVRGAGKSNTAAVMAEEMFATGLPFVVIDPVGSWYGLRSSADGTRAGLAIPIFGGKHGDVPLERGAGELIADLVVEKRLTCVLDLSRFESEADKKAFLLAFARRLYAKNENPLHLFLEEADDYIPQSPMGDEKVLLRAWENIVRRGRARGLGMTLITQRSAAVAKMVLTQVETLFAMRTTGPQDIAAIEAWVKYHQVGKDVLSTLASLEDGEAWVWSPHYLKAMARHQIRRRQTFDSGATPGNVRAKDTRPPATLADIDLEALQERMAATIEKAKADDPKALRARIAELERLNAQAAKQAQSTQRVTGLSAGSSNSNEQAKPEVREILTDADRELLKAIASELCDHHDLDDTVAAAVEQLRAAVQAAVEKNAGWIGGVAELRAKRVWHRVDKAGFRRILEKLDRVSVAPAGNVITAPKTLASSPQLRVSPSHSHGLATPGATRDAVVKLAQHLNGHAAGTLPGPEQKILNAVAELEVLGLHPADKIQVGLLAGYTNVRSGGFSEPLGRLVASGHLVSPQVGKLAITDEGRAAAVVAEAPTTPDEMQARVLGKLTRPEQKLLRALIGAYPSAVTKEDLGAECGYTNIRSGGFSEPLGRLNTLGIVRTPARGSVVAAPFLFLEA